MSDIQLARNTRHIWLGVIAAVVMIAMIVSLLLFSREFTQAGEDRAARAAIRTNGAGEQVTPRERYENFKSWQADQVDQTHDAIEGDEMLALP